MIESPGEVNKEKMLTNHILGFSLECKNEGR